MAQEASSSFWEGRPSRLLGTFLDSLLRLLTTLLHPAVALSAAMTRKKRNKNAAAPRRGGEEEDGGVDPEKMNPNNNNNKINASSNSNNANVGQFQSSSSAAAAVLGTSSSPSHNNNNNMNGHATSAVSNSAVGTGPEAAGGAAPLKKKENVAPVRETSVLDEQIIQGVAGLNVSTEEGKQQQQQQNGQASSASLSTRPSSSVIDENEDPVKAEQRRIHQGFMNDALDMARLALKTNETPVGCVLVYDGRVVAKGMNATNITRNGTRHAELMAICALMSYTKDKDLEKPITKKGSKKGSKAARKEKPKPEVVWGDVDPKDGHLYPYGQKLHPAPQVNRDIISQCTLYVTVEPCVMCASLLRQYGIKKVYFGAVNDKFGGTGGVFNIHMNAGTTDAPQSPSLRPPISKPRPPLARQPTSANGSTNSVDKSSAGGESSESARIEIPQPRVAMPMRIGDGGNVEPGYEVEGGWGRDEAVNLLRQFYVQENGRAPVPRKKEGRAARLAAMMEKDGMTVEGTGLLDDGASANITPGVEEGSVVTTTNSNTNVNGHTDANGNTNEKNDILTNGDASEEPSEPVTLASTSDAKA